MNTKLNTIQIADDVNFCRDLRGVLVKGKKNALSKLRKSICDVNKKNIVTKGGMRYKVSLYKEINGVRTTKANYRLF